MHRLEIIREFVKNGNYRLTLHAENERDLDHIFKYEIEEAFLSKKAEIIEDYPDDPRGGSFLLLGFTKEDLPIHFVCALQEELIIITMYRPQADKWIECKYRRRY